MTADCEPLTREGASQWNTSARSAQLRRSADSDGGQMRRITTALYVDFDNIYGGLAEFDRGSAETFANDPGRMLQFLSRGTDDEGEFERRFLVRDCYINPHSFAKYRAQFVAAGFRVIDCPSLTQRGKSAADTHIVIDVVDAISHATRYDEFIICSADADFSPLMTKLRRHARRTVMVAAGYAAPAYKAVCDTTIGAMEIVAAFTLDDGESEGQPAGVASLPPIDEDDVARAVEAVRARVAASASAVPGSSAAAAARRAVPGIARSDWAGAGGFTAFVRQHLPELSYVSTNSGGLVLDPVRHKVAAGAAEVEEPDEVNARVARVTNVPPLTSAQYGVLFQELAVVAKAQPRLARIGYDVRERAADSAAPVPRKSVDFVVTGLVYAGCDPRTANLGARGLAEKWLANVLFLCEQAGLELEQVDKEAIARWITGGVLPEDASE
jgi:hypothetical protein